MKKITIGKTDLQIAPINFGGNVFGWTLDEKQSFEILDAFVNAGFNFIDTADTYSWWVEGNKGGESEAIIGKWMKARNNRDKVVIATKVGSQNKEHKEDVSRAHILKSVDESLQRLQTDHIDLYYTHFDDNVTPLEETLSAYDEIIKAGKVKYIAASNLTPERLTASLKLAEEKGLPRYQALQPHYNLVERANFETKYQPIAQQYGLSVMPYWSLAAGFLTGKYRSEEDFKKSVRGEGVRKYLDAKGIGVLHALDKVAAKHNSKPATVALAWLLAQPTIAAPIVSATSQHQLETLVAAPALQLDAEDLGLLDNASK
ncbi:aldo/keto reductase [[Flexibacter] sp. ATCC 35208]|uniref:aldo/keto reductase n=1 Tax=[Flexibacter] sp. ATCC 35208 TaxID=1936242 RepID=UPI0009D06629|nr:aldo/keto reductase [[Flexibacter] sp. ATCC 35208]OMP80853.1 alcohol dehydrogenase [[Flexibacter] sp. ATCC 35208]